MLYFPDFYPLDLGSVLTVLLLDVQPETRMLDLCSAPGGKAVVSLQTLNLSKLVIIIHWKSKKSQFLIVRRCLNA